MLRQRFILFLIVTVVLLGGALLIYGQRTGRLTIFGATPTSPAAISVNTTVDLQKGASAGDGNVELVGNVLQLKKGSQFSSWTKEAGTPDFLLGLSLFGMPTAIVSYGQAIGGDSREFPQTTSFDEKTKKFFVSSASRIASYDSVAKTWSTAVGMNGYWASWSNKLQKLIALQGNGSGNPNSPSNIVALNPTGDGAQLLYGNVSFETENKEALYHDPVSDTVVGFRQINAAIAGLGDYCRTCTADYPKVLELFNPGTGQYDRITDSTTGGAWPEPRVGASVAYDPIKKEVLVFGGFTVTPVLSSIKTGLDTLTNYTYAPASVLWAFDTTTRAWSQRIGSNQPPARAFSKITYDQKNKRFVLFGGMTSLTTAPTSNSNTVATSNDLWSYDPATNAWQLINIPTPPEARFGHGIGYNSIDQQLLIFAGQQGATSTQQFGPNLPPRITDTWTASAGGFASTGTCQFDVGSPQVQQIFRYQSIKTKDLPAGTSINVRFAGSVDGVSFNPFSQPYTYTAGSATPDSVDLSAILPANTHFVRVVCNMTSNGTATPVFEGFTVDYQAIGTESPAFTITPLLGQAPLTVNATRTDSLTTACTLNFGDSTADVTINANQTLSHIYQNPGTFTATMSCGGQTSTQIVTVTSQPSASVLLTTSKSSYTPSETVNFTFQNLGPAGITIADTVPFVIKQAATGQVIFDPTGQPTPQTLVANDKRLWTWDQKRDDGSLASVGSYLVSVPYTVVGQSQPTTKDVTFTIQADPTPIPLSFTVTPTQGVAPLEVTANYTGTLTNLVWDFGDGTIQTASQGPSQVKHTYQLAGTYTISLRSGTSSGSQTVLVSSGSSTGNTSAPILVNGSISGTLTNSSGVTAAPKSLVATGANPIVLSLFAAWLAASAMILTYRPKRAKR